MKYALSVLSMTMVLSSGAAFANPTLGPVESAKDDLIIASPSGLQHQLIAEGGLNAGQLTQNTVLAKGTVTVTGEAVGSVALKWGNGVPAPSYENAHNYRQLSGTNPDNKLVVALGPASGFSSAQYEATSSYNIVSTGGLANVFNYEVGSIYQAVNADTYTMIVNAHKFNS